VTRTLQALLLLLRGLTGAMLRLKGEGEGEGAMEQLTLKVALLKRCRNLPPGAGEGAG
jgi:hypothetical protein